MQPAETSNLEHVTSILNYIDYTGERPAYYIYDPKSTKVGIPPGPQSTPFRSMTSVTSSMGCHSTCTVLPCIAMPRR